MISLPLPTRRGFRRWLHRTQPTAVLATLYVGLILLGMIALQLPFATTRPISAMDALFTSTSAVTVTGLSVIDTGTALTFWGQFIVMVLIQLGGLGLMTFAVLVFSALGMPIGITQTHYLREDLGQTSYDSLMRLVRTIFRVVLLAEIAGAMLLAISFVPEFGFAAGIWHAMFHSVSAFNNAGFSTFSQNLTGYAGDPIVNLVIPALFITGGIGYLVISDISRRPFWRGYTLHSKLMLSGTLALIVLGVGLTAVLEWNNPRTLGSYDATSTKLMVAWFQGTTPRTAGFNTADIGGLHDSTSLLYMALMMVGGGPTSTAGGLKVTTVMVMLLATIAFLGRRTQVAAFGRSVTMEQVMQVMALVAIASILTFSSVFLIAVTHDGHFLDICFEVVSAFGTTGLSRGYTGELNTFGRAVIVVIMFIGRVGPLTLGVFLATRMPSRVRYPAGQLHLG